jgi:hypothetical protein
MLSTAILLLLLNKPLCTKKTHGQMWPDAANHDKTALLTLARSGVLEMCVSSTWGYKWEHLTVNIHQKPI